MVKTLVSGYRGQQFKPQQHQYVVSLSITSVDSAVKLVPIRNTLVKCVYSVV